MWFLLRRAAPLPPFDGWDRLIPSQPVDSAGALGRVGEISQKQTRPSDGPEGQRPECSVTPRMRVVYRKF